SKDRRRPCTAPAVNMFGRDSTARARLFKVYWPPSVVSRSSSLSIRATGSGKGMLGRRRMMGREETVAIRSIRSLSVASLLFAVVVLALSPTSSAQSSIDEIHVVPRVALESPTREIDASLDAHTKPIKKEVDLVLVPVTITDPMDRLVIGLEQDNFQVFDGKQPQQIKHFSSEDTPVSRGV